MHFRTPSHHCHQPVCAMLRDIMYEVNDHHTRRHADRGNYSARKLRKGIIFVVFVFFVNCNTKK